MERALGYRALVLLTEVELTCFTPGVVLTGALKPGVFHFSGAQHCPGVTESKFIPPWQPCVSQAQVLAQTPKPGMPISS